MSAVLFCALLLLGVIFQEMQTLIYLNVRKVACAEISQATYKHILSLVRAWSSLLWCWFGGVVVTGCGRDGR